MLFFVLKPLLFSIPICHNYIKKIKKGGYMKKNLFLTLFLIFSSISVDLLAQLEESNSETQDSNQEALEKHRRRRRRNHCRNNQNCRRHAHHHGCRRKGGRWNPTTRRCEKNGQPLRIMVIDEDLDAAADEIGIE